MLATSLTKSDFSPHGLTVHQARINPAGGPVWLFFSPLATHPGAKNNEIFGAAALLWQDGVPLGTFSGLALEQFANAPDWWTSESRRDSAAKLSQLLEMRDNEELNEAFGDFVLWSWQQVWQAFEPSLPSDGEFKLVDDIIRHGRFNIVQSGLFMSVEETFFHRAMPSDKRIKEIFDDYGLAATIRHPFYLQKFSSLVAGMGYTPDLDDKRGVPEAMGWNESSYMQPIAHVNRMAELLWACRNRDLRLEPFRAQGW
jgi:hypothetical protein